MVKTLIVDDNAAFRQSFAVHLYQNFPDMVIAQAATADEAVEKINSILPDLMIIDIQLPGQSGLELTKRIKEIHPEIIVAILTAYDLPEYRDAARQYGAEHFFSKSASSTEELVNLIRARSSDAR